MLGHQTPSRVMPSAVRTILAQVVFLLLFLLGLGWFQNASAQALFSGVSISPTSGTAGAGGTLTISATGTAQSKLNTDAVNEVDLMEGATVLAYQTYPVNYNGSTGNPINYSRSINLSAGLSPGTHYVFLRAYTENGFSTDSTWFTITVSPSSVNGASFFSQSVPTEMNAGQSYPVSVTMQNTGTKTWSPSDYYALGSAGDNYTWGFNRVYIGSTVGQNGTYTFSFTVTAPSTPGTYSFQWGMLQEYVEWFGGYSPNVSVRVILPQPSASFTSPSEGATYTASGSTATVAFSGTASPGTGASISSVQLSEGGVAFASGSGTSISGSKDLSVGSHTIQLSVTDSRNQTASVTRNVSVVPSAPTASFSSPSNGASFSTTGSTTSVPITASGSPGSGASISQLRLYVDGSWTTYYSSTINTSLTLGAGSHTLGVQAIDNYGTTGATSYITISVVAPTPTATVDSPGNNSYFVATGTTAAVAVSGSAVAVGGSAITKLELLDQGAVIDTLTNVSTYSKTVNLTVGQHSLALRATNAAGLYGTSSAVTVQVEAVKAGDSARFISQSVPTTMRAGQPYTVSVTMLNNGTTTWTDGSNYKLGAQNPTDNRNFGGRAFLSGSVATGQTAVFTFQVTAPTTPNTYNFQWQMLREYIAWFGDLTSNQPITVTQGTGPTATLTASPTNVRVSGAQTQSVQFSGSGARSGGTVTKLELFQDSGRGYGMSPVNTTTGSASTLNYSYSLSLGAGTYSFKLRATDSGGVQTDSAPVMVNVTNSGLLGTVSGVRSNASGNPELFGWVCQSGNASGLSYKVLLDAPTLEAGATVLTTGTANVNTELDSASVQSQCSTPGAGHHFVVDLSTYVSTYAGRALYVFAQTSDASSTVTLPCADNNCTMPGTLRVGLTQPLNGAQINLPNPVFMKMQLTNASGTYDEIGFLVDGQWVAATPDGAPGAYSGSLTLTARTAPYTVYAKVRQGNTTIQSVSNQFTVINSTSTIGVTSPSDGSTVGMTAQTLVATVSGTVSSVKFFVNGTQLTGSASGSGTSWTQAWTPSAVGPYSILARAYDSAGTQIAQSLPVSVTVSTTGSSATPLPIVLDVPQLANGTGGTLPGSVSVDSAGGAVYSIPLQLPPGILGMVPALSISYDSNSPIGSAGLGWSVGGISKIDRCGKTLALDGRNDTVRFTLGDRLCLDGQRLVLVNGTAVNDANYWADNAEYRTEVESFTRVTAIIANSKRAFKVETKDGRTSYYGDTGDSYIEAVGRGDGLAHRWYVSRTSDRSGNKIDYTYTEDNATGEAKPASVSWGANTTKNTPNFAKASFVWEARKSPRVSYVAGSIVTEALRLQRVDTTVDTSENGAGNWTSALTYNLTYGVSPSSGRDLLTSVRACDATQCLPATTFNYGERDSSAQQTFAILGATRSGPNLEQLAGVSSSVMDFVASADFDGDGKTDIIERYRSSANNNQQRLYQSNPDGLGWTITTPLINLTGDSAIIDVGDFDGDGLTDLIVADRDSNLVPSNWRLCLGKNRSSGNYSCTSFTLPAGAVVSPYAPYHTTRDFNGDGKDDFYIQSDSTSTHHSFQCLATGTGFTCTDVTNTRDELQLADGPKKDYSSGSVFTDVDGDGRTDRVNLSKCKWSKGDGELSFSWHCGGGPYGDDTGGISVYNTPEVGGVYLSGGWNQFANLHTGIIPSVTGGTLNGDLNADGYSDLVFGSVDLISNSNYGTFSGRLCSSYGEGHAECRALPQSNYPSQDHMVLHVGDFDGDGVPDALRPANDAWNQNNVTGYLLCRIGRDRDLGADTLYHRCEQWTGPTFYADSLKTVFGGNASTIAANGSRSTFLGDFDGDGKQDIATYLGNGQWQIYSAANQAKPNQALDRLVSVVNGRANSETIDYALPNDSGSYTSTVSRPDGANAIGKLTYPSRPLVKAVHKGNGIVGTRDETYKYARMALDSAGRGNLGFAEIKKTDVQRGITTSIWPCLTYPNIGAECGRKEESSLKVVLNSTTNEWTTQTLNYSNGASTSYGYTSKSTVARRDLLDVDLGTVVTTTQTPDSWGNVLDTTATYSPDSWSVHRVMTYDNDPSTWRLGELRTTTETRSNNFNTISRTSSYTYDSQGRLSSESRVSADATQQLTTTYDRSTASYGLVGKTTLSWTDASANAKSRTVSDVTYTSNGRFVFSIKNALGQVEQQTFDARTGVTASVISANALATSTTSDGFGRLQSVTTPDGTRSETYYKDCSSNCPAGATGVTIHETKQAGAVRAAVPVVQFLDNVGRVSRSQTWGFDGRKVITDTVFDEVGRTQKLYWARYATDSEALASLSSNPSGALLQQQTLYDELDRPATVKMTGELGELRSTTHTWNGFTHQIQNPLNQIISETRDVWGKLKSTRDANGKDTQFSFDAFGNLSKTTDPLGNVVLVSFDDWGRRIQLQDPDLGITKYKVDPLGQVWKQESPNETAAGTATVTTFDDLGRMVTRVSSDLTATWTYDLLPGQSGCASYHSCGQLVRSSTLAGGTAIDYRQDRSYDSIGRPDTTTTVLDVTYTSKQSYDAWGRPISEQHQRGSDTAKVYDKRYNAWGQLARIERSGQPIWTASAQDAPGRITSWALGNGFTVAKNFNGYTGRVSDSTVTGAQGIVLQDGYQYDAVGNALQRFQQWGGSSFTENFEYDQLNRLWHATIVGYPQQVFVYDDIGNMVSKSGVGTGNYAYASFRSDNVLRAHAVSSIPGIGNFVYDDNGNLKSGAGRTITWNSFDMPITIAKGTSTSTFYYGPDHQRVKQVRSDGVTLWYAGAIEVEASGTGAVVKTYLPNGIGVEIDKAGTTQLNYTHLDRLGNVVAISNQAATVVETMAYDSWGKRRQLAASSTPDSIDGVTDNKGFTGHEMLDQVDLVHMNGRVYDPFVARFTSADPIIQNPEHSQSYNRYTYVWNNPTNLTDPTGFVGLDSGNGGSSGVSENCNIQCMLEKRREKDCADMAGNCTLIGQSNTDRARRGGKEDSGGAGNSSNSANNGKQDDGGITSNIAKEAKLLMRSFTDYLFRDEEGKEAWSQHFEMMKGSYGYGKTNRLEMQLFDDYLRTIPNYLRRDPETIAYVFAGFDDFARKGALRYAATSVMDFEKSNLFGRGFNVESLKSIGSAGLRINSVSRIPALFQEAGYISVYGPAVINRATYEKVYGSPIHNWGAYYPGWQVPTGWKK